MKLPVSNARDLFDQFLRECLGVEEQRRVYLKHFDSLQNVPLPKFSCGGPRQSSTSFPNYQHSLNQYFESSNGENAWCLVEEVVAAMCELVAASTNVGEFGVSGTKRDDDSRPSTPQAPSILPVAPSADDKIQFHLLNHLHTTTQRIVDVHDRKLEISYVIYGGI